MTNPYAVLAERQKPVTKTPEQKQAKRQRQKEQRTSKTTNTTHNKVLAEQQKPVTKTPEQEQAQQQRQIQQRTSKTTNTTHISDRKSIASFLIESSEQNQESSSTEQNKWKKFPTVEGSGLRGGCRRSSNYTIVSEAVGNPENSINTEFFQKMRLCLEGLVETVSNFGYLGIAFYYNFLRDFFWTYITCASYNDRLRTTANWSEQNYAQWLWGTAAMVAGLLLHYIACKLAGRPMPWIKALIAIIAASLAIPGWNKVGEVAQNVGENSLKLPPDLAGYFAGAFTGVAEGPIQEAITSLGNSLADAAERNKFTANPGRYLTEFAKRFGLSFTVGIIPGDVWQWVCNAGQTNNVNIIITSALVAFAVGTCNIGCAKTNEKILTTKLCSAPVHEVNERSALTAVPHV